MSVLASIPIHPLLVHVPVVMLPLAALGAVALVIRQKWVQHYGWLVVGGVVVAFGGSVLASGSGDDLLEQYQSSGQHISSTLNSHAELGESVQWIALLFLVLTAAWVFAHKRQLATKAVRIVLAVFVALSAVAATVMVIEAGHNGAKAKWEQTK